MNLEKQLFISHYKPYLEAHTLPLFGDTQFYDLCLGYTRKKGYGTSLQVYGRSTINLAGLIGHFSFQQD